MLFLNDKSRPGTGTVRTGIELVRSRRPWAVGCRVVREFQ